MNTPRKKTEEIFSVWLKLKDKKVWDYWRKNSQTAKQANKESEGESGSDIENDVKLDEQPVHLFANKSEWKNSTIMVRLNLTGRGCLFFFTLLNCLQKRFIIFEVFLCYSVFPEPTPQPKQHKPERHWNFDPEDSKWWKSRDEKRRNFYGNIIIDVAGSLTEPNLRFGDQNNDLHLWSPDLIWKVSATQSVISRSRIDENGS